MRRLEYPYEAWISVARVCMLCGCASVSERALLCLFLCVSRCFRGETVRTAYSTCSDVDTRGHAHSCAHPQAPLSVSHRWLRLDGNQLASLSPTQFADNTRLTYVAISLSSPAHARTHARTHVRARTDIDTRATTHTLASAAALSSTCLCVSHRHLSLSDKFST